MNPFGRGELLEVPRVLFVILSVSAGLETSSLPKWARRSGLFCDKLADRVNE